MGNEGGGLTPPSSLTGASVVDRSLGVHEFMQLGHPGQVAAEMVTPILIIKDCPAGAISHTIFNANAPFAFKIMSVQVIAHATVGSGSCKLTDGTNDITDTVACATDTNVDYLATLDETYQEVALGGTLKVVQNHADTDGEVIITIVRTGATAA